jgi:hypothetical protein
VGLEDAPDATTEEGLGAPTDGTDTGTAIEEDGLIDTGTATEEDAGLFEMGATTGGV